jgi:hypothetical protein
LSEDIEARLEREVLLENSKQKTTSIIPSQLQIKRETPAAQSFKAVGNVLQQQVNTSNGDEIVEAPKPPPRKTGFRPISKPVSTKSSNTSAKTLKKPSEKIRFEFSTK